MNTVHSMKRYYIQLMFFSGADIDWRQIYQYTHFHVLFSMIYDTTRIVFLHNTTYMVVVGGDHKKRRNISLGASWNDLWDDINRKKIIWWKFQQYVHHTRMELQGVNFSHRKKPTKHEDKKNQRKRAKSKKCFVRLCIPK